MSRKIISLYDTYGYSFPHLPPKELDGNIDIEWENEKNQINLGHYNHKAYLSIRSEHTLENLQEGILDQTKDYEIQFEESFDVDFISNVLYRQPHKNKYIEDAAYLQYLGFPQLSDEDITIINTNIGIQVGIASTTNEG